MKRIITLILAAGLTLGAVTQASAIDFKAKGQWIMGFGYVDSNFTPKVNGKRHNGGDDKFAALQRVRLQMDAVASEALSGTVYFEIGDQTWGKADKGAALGTDGTEVEVKRAYLDWIVPNTDLSIRMGLQGVTLPNVAGGSAIMDDDVAGITANYKFNDMVSLTALWARPYNDNYSRGDSKYRQYGNGFLDNVDLFALMLPITGDGFKVTPWAMIGFSGKNAAVDGSAYRGNMGLGMTPAGVNNNYMNTRDAYSTSVFAGLPIAITALDPLNIELDINYGYSEGFGRYDAHNNRYDYDKRARSVRTGWLAKALVEYKMDWGTPGIFGWYASGDDGSVKNGSERMPTISPCGNFTSFMGDGDINGWSIWSGNNLGYDLMLNYSGTWGIGAQLKDMSFLEGLKHTLRVAYWGGTNSPAMVKYLDATHATGRAGIANEGVYLTTNDGLIEVNFDTTYQIYENLTATVELGYIGNLIDEGTWDRYYNDSFTKGDGYKAALILNYSF